MLKSLVLATLLLLVAGCKGKEGDGCTENSDCQSNHCGDCLGGYTLPDGGVTEKYDCLCEP